ncbi:MAG: HAD-IA family hydrolase [Capsulimonadales bacterium]|nr:HAD-IA family hydrolase [Capsulimonadales bacterium]
MDHRPIDALFLDFDGTILDTETLEYQAWEEVYAFYGQELPLALWADSIGRGANDVKFDPYNHLRTLVGHPLDDAVAHTRRRARFLEMIEAAPVRPGILEYLADAEQRNLPVAVVSSSNHDWVDGHLRRLGILDAFAFTRCYGDVPLAKPHPDLYLSACETFGVPPTRTLAVEDSPNGLHAAKRARVFALAFPNPLTALLDLSHADLRVDDLAAFPVEHLLRHLHAAASAQPPSPENPDLR